MLQLRRALRLGLTKERQHLITRDPLRRAARRLEGLPSGQRQQTVNLPTYVFVGSNPTPSTSFFGSRQRLVLGAGSTDGEAVSKQGAGRRTSNLGGGATRV
jgi:hypothetical protein